MAFGQGLLGAYTLYNQLKNPLSAAYNEVLLPTLVGAASGKYNFADMNPTEQMSPEDAAEWIGNIRQMNAEEGLIKTPVSSSSGFDTPIATQTNIPMSAETPTPELMHSGRGPLLSELATYSSKIDAELGPLLETRGKLMDEIRAPNDVGDNKLIGNILGSLASFGIGYAAGGGGQMGLGLGLLGAGRSAKAFWDSVDQQRAREDQATLIQLRDNYSTEERLRRQQFEGLKTAADIEADTAADLANQQWEREKLGIQHKNKMNEIAARNKGEEDSLSPEGQELLAKANEGSLTSDDIRKANIPLSEMKIIMSGQRIEQGEEVLRRRGDEELRRQTDAYSRLTQSAQAGFVATKPTLNEVEKKNIPLVRGSMDAMNQMFAEARASIEEGKGFAFFGKAGLSQEAARNRFIEIYRRVTGSGANFTELEMALGSSQLGGLGDITEAIRATVLDRGNKETLLANLDKAQKAWQQISLTSLAAYGVVDPKQADKYPAEIKERLKGETFYDLEKVAASAFPRAYERIAKGEVESPFTSSQANTTPQTSADLQSQLVELNQRIAELERRRAAAKGGL